jgi:hypothetical protein
VLTAKLIIKFDGDARGLADKRLSLSEFSRALGELLKAYRRTASNLLVHATGETASSTGRLHRLAEQLDLEIETIVGNSVQPVFVATQAPLGLQELLIQDLAPQALDRLLNDIDQEQQGRAQSKVARDYLDSLPKTVTSQSYTLRVGDKDVRTVTFGVPTLVELPGELPRLFREAGQVVGVGFSPGEPYVELTSTSRSKPIVCRAPTELVDLALTLRGKPVEFMAVGSDRFRLLWIRDASQPFQPLEPADRLARIHKDWSETLTELGR